MLLDFPPYVCSAVLDKWLTTSEISNFIVSLCNEKNRNDFQYAMKAAPFQVFDEYSCGTESTGQFVTWYCGLQSHLLAPFVLNDGMHSLANVDNTSGVVIWNALGEKVISSGHFVERLCVRAVPVRKAVLSDLIYSLKYVKEISVCCSNCPIDFLFKSIDSCLKKLVLYDAVYADNDTFLSDIGASEINLTHLSLNNVRGNSQIIGPLMEKILRRSAKTLNYLSLNAPEDSDPCDYYHVSFEELTSIQALNKNNIKISHVNSIHAEPKTDSDILQHEMNVQITKCVREAFETAFSPFLNSFR